MPAIDVVDETFLAVEPRAVVAAFTDPRAWRRYWPDLELEIYVDRGEAGLRWTVRGGLTGTMEVWLEPMLDGTLLHYFLRAELVGAPDRAPVGDRDVRREIARRQLAAKRIALDLKEILEAGREPGCPP